MVIARRLLTGIALVVVTAIVTYFVTAIWSVVEAFTGGGGPAIAVQQVAAAGSAVLLDDGKTVVYDDPRVFCATLSLAVEQTPSVVKLGLSESDGECGDYLAYQVASPGAQASVVVGSGIGRAGSQRVVLESALGNRPLVDALTGRTIPVFDQRRAPRFRTGPEWSAGSISTIMPYFGGDGAAVMVDSFAGVGGHRVVRIIEVAGGGWHPPPGTVTRPVTVRGRPGRAATGIIVWSERSLTIAVLGGGATPLPRGALLSVANALTWGN